MKRWTWALRFGVVAVVVTLGIAAYETFGTLGGGALACPLLSNRTVPLLARIYPGCPLEPLDRVVRVRDGAVTRRIYALDDLARVVASGAAAVDLEIERRGESHWIRVPVVNEASAAAASRFAAAAVIALLLVWTSRLLSRSRAPAAAAFGLLYLSLAVLIGAAIGGRYAARVQWPLVGAMCVLPASLVHLALVFPRPRAIVRDLPALIGAPYVVATVLLLTVVSAFPRYPVVWELLQRVLQLEMWIASAVVIGSCAAAAWRSDSRLERTQMRVFLGALALCAVIPALLAAVLGERLPGGALTIATLAVGLAPLPLGYAVARCHLLGLDIDVRQAATRALELAALTIVFFGLALGLDLGPALREPPVLFAAILVAVVAGAWLQGRLRAALARWIEPAGEHWERLGAHYVERLQALRDAEASARIAADALASGLESRGVAVFLLDEGRPRLVYATDEPAALDASIAADAVALAREAGAELARVAPLPERAVEQRLARAGVELIATFVHEERSLGLALIASSRRGNPYTSRHLAFCSAVARHAAAAIRNAELAENLAVAERYAALGRVRAFLLHDLGKPLGTIELLARRLPYEIGDPARAGRDAAAIAALATQVRALVSELREPASAVAAVHDSDRVADAVEAAQRSIEGHGGRAQVSVRVAPGLPRLGRSLRAVTRILTNVLDNALQAGGDLVEVSACERNGRLELVVSDNGSGMAPETRRRAFEPFYSTRPPGAGQGLGLAISREVAQSIGGAIALESVERKGTVVRIEVPIETRGAIAPDVI